MGWCPGQSPLPLGSHWCSTRSESKGQKKKSRKLLRCLCILPSHYQSFFLTQFEYIRMLSFQCSVLWTHPEWAGDDGAPGGGAALGQRASQARMRRRWRLVSGRKWRGRRARPSPASVLLRHAAKAGIPHRALRLDIFSTVFSPTFKPFSLKVIGSMKGKVQSVDYTGPRLFPFQAHYF